MLDIQINVWSWQVGSLLMVLSIIALLIGSLPDNPRRPFGDVLRLITWPLFLIWLGGAVLKGIGVFG